MRVSDLDQPTTDHTFEKTLYPWTLQGGPSECFHIMFILEQYFTPGRGTLENILQWHEARGVILTLLYRQADIDIGAYQQGGTLP